MAVRFVRRRRVPSIRQPPVLSQLAVEKIFLHCATCLRYACQCQSAGISSGDDIAVYTTVPLAGYPLLVMRTTGRSAM